MAIVYLLISIVSSSLISLIFKEFGVRGIQKLPAVIVNYFVCFGLGLLLASESSLLENLSQEWFRNCILLGFLFVAIFMAMALIADKIGASVMAVSSKMSVVLPVLYIAIMTAEEIKWLYIIGLVLSLLSIYFVSVKKELSIDRKWFAFPLIVFIGSGAIDISLKVFDQRYAADVDSSVITYSIFLGAFIAGIVMYTIRQLAFKREKLRLKDIGAGIFLGIPNYFSIYFLLLSINAFSDNSAMVFGINNISIVLLSTVLAVLFYKEEINTKNKLGLVLAIVSILIIANA